MKRKEIGNKIVFSVFIVFICLPWILWFFFEKYTDTSNYENRDMYAQPRLTLDTYRQFPEDYTAYFNDRIPFRNALVTLNNAIDYFVFKTSSDKRVIIGQDNWLFYCDKADGDPIGCYQGTNLLSEEELAIIAQNCLKQRELLASLGKEFVIFIAPNKERMYPEYMPEYYGTPAETYQALQIVDYLKENTDIRVVYPYEELLETKMLIKESTYYKTDTHWNYIGAYVGSASLLRELGIKMPSLDSAGLNIESVGNYSGDLAAFLGLSKPLAVVDREYAIEGYDEHNLKGVCGEFRGALLYTAENADSRKLYIYRDSFATSMIPFIGSQFNESYFRHRDTYSYDDFLSQNPDVFIYETVERYAGNLATFSIYFNQSP